MRERTPLAVSLLVLVAAACGAPKAPDGAAPAPSATEVAPSASADPAPSTSTTTAPPASASAGAFPVDAPKPGTITMDDDDGCTKIAAAFEQKARPKIKECYREGKKSNAALEGSVRITLAVDGFGKLGDPKAQEATLPDAVVKCMVKAVKETPFDDASKCKRKGIALPIQFPTK